MAINKKLIYFKKKLHYANERANGMPRTSICFVEETDEIITHDHVFHGALDKTFSWIPITLPTVNTQWSQVTSLNLDLALGLSGTYYILVLYDNTYFSGTLSLALNTEIVTDEEVILHACGNSTSHLYLKVAPDPKTKHASLWLSTSQPIESYTVTIKFRQLI